MKNHRYTKLLPFLCGCCLAAFFLAPITAEAGLFIKLGDIKGNATDDHKDWLVGESISFSIFRSIAEGAQEQQRNKGKTTLGGLVITRQLSKASTKLFEACANGTFFKEVEIHLTTTVKNKQEPYLTLKISDVIITSVTSHANASGDPLPTEEITLSYTAVEWNYITLDPETGDKTGNVPAKYDPSTSRG